MSRLWSTSASGTEVLPKLRCSNTSESGSLRQVRGQPRWRRRGNRKVPTLQPGRSPCRDEAVVDGWMGLVWRPASVLPSTLLDSIRDRRMQTGNSEMFCLRSQDWLRSWVKALALIAFGGYVLWNATWLFSGRIPPSILAYYTGFPCPTTGMTRSLLSLCEGDWRSFFLFNPLTSVFLALTGISTVALVKRRLQREGWVLPAFLTWSWLSVLLLGWFLKIVIGNEYW